MRLFYRTVSIIPHSVIAAQPGVEIAVAGCRLCAGCCAFHGVSGSSPLQPCAVGCVTESVLQVRNHSLDEMKWFVQYTTTKQRNEDSHPHLLPDTKLSSRYIIKLPVKITPLSSHLLLGVPGRWPKTCPARGRFWPLAEGTAVSHSPRNWPVCCSNQELNRAVDSLGGKVRLKVAFSFVGCYRWQVRNTPICRRCRDCDKKHKRASIVPDHPPDIPCCQRRNGESISWR